MENTKKKVISYLRVSTENQSLEDKFGLEAQREAIKKYCDEHNFEIVEEFKDVVSGCADVKPEWDKLILADDITNPPFDAIVVFKSDRVSRRIEQYFYYFYKLKLKNIELISVQEDYGEDNAMAGIMRSLMLFVAEQERKNIALRTSNGRKIKALKGGYSGGKTPFGYNVVDGKLVINEEEAKVVREIFAMSDDNLSTVFIAKALNRDGFRIRKGTEWTNAHIFYILKNRPLYEGMYRYGTKEWSKGLHEAIL